MVPPEGPRHKIDLLQPRQLLKLVPTVFLIRVLELQFRDSECNSCKTLLRESCTLCIGRGPIWGHFEARKSLTIVEPHLIPPVTFEHRTAAKMRFLNLKLACHRGECPWASSFTSSCAAAAHVLSMFRILEAEDTIYAHMQIVVALIVVKIGKPTYKNI